MAISSPGVGSGLDVNSIVTQLVAIERQPLQTLQTKAATLQSQLSLYGTIKSQASALQDAATVLATAANWTVQSATSSNMAAVTVSADSTASSTEFGLEVTRLATVQTTASRSVNIGTTLGAGLAVRRDVALTFSRRVRAAFHRRTTGHPSAHRPLPRARRGATHEVRRHEN